MAGEIVQIELGTDIFSQGLYFNLNTFNMEFPEDYYENHIVANSEEDSIRYIGTSVTNGYGPTVIYGDDDLTISGSQLIIDRFVSASTVTSYYVGHLSMESARIGHILDYGNYNNTGYGVGIDLLSSINDPLSYSDVAYERILEESFFQTVSARIVGTSGSDTIIGGVFGDFIIGSQGTDILSGGDGDDVLNAGYDYDIDTLTGGNGRDIFAVSTFGGLSNGDIISDFSIGDQIQISRGYVPANFASSQVAIGDGATLRADEIELMQTADATLLLIGVDENPGADAQIELSGDYRGRAFFATGAIVSLTDVPVVSISAGPVVSEGSNGSGNTLNFTVSRTGDLSQNLMVYYEFSESFTDRFGDQRLKNFLDVREASSPNQVNRIEIPAGQSSATITLTTFGDNIPELNAEVALNIVASSTYNIDSEAASAENTIIDDDGPGGIANTIRGIFTAVIDAHYGMYYDAYDPYTQTQDFIDEAWRRLTLDLRDATPLDENLRNADYYLQSLYFLESSPELFRDVVALTLSPAAELYDALKAIGQADLAGRIFGRDNPNNPNTGPGGAQYTNQGINDYFSGDWRDYLPGSNENPMNPRRFSENFDESDRSIFYIRSIETNFSQEKYQLDSEILIPTDEFPANYAGEAFFFDFSGGDVSLGSLGDTLIVFSDRGRYDLGSGDDLLKVFFGSHYIVGGAGDDILLMGEGEDTVEGGCGDDMISGGDGSDVAIYSGVRARYDISQTEDGSVVVIDQRCGSPDGRDVISGIENIQFRNGIFSVDTLLLA